jgi:hypothetical protein
MTFLASGRIVLFHLFFLVYWWTVTLTFAPRLGGTYSHVEGENTSYIGLLPSCAVLLSGSICMLTNSAGESALTCW